MWPLKTYLDIADTSYARGKPLGIRRKWGRIRIRDSNTAFKDYMRIDVMDAKVRPDQSVDDSTETNYASVRLTRAEVKRVYSALGRFLKRSDKWRSRK